MCCAADVLEGKGAVQVAITVCELLRFHTQQIKSPMKNLTRPPNAATASPTTS